MSPMHTVIVCIVFQKGSICTCTLSQNIYILLGDQELTESSGMHTNKKPALFPVHKPQVLPQGCTTLLNSLKKSRVLWTVSK